MRRQSASDVMRALFQKYESERELGSKAGRKGLLCLSESGLIWTWYIDFVPVIIDNVLEISLVFRWKGFCCENRRGKKSSDWSQARENGWVSVLPTEWLQLQHKPTYYTTTMHHCVLKKKKNDLHRK